MDGSNKVQIYKLPNAPATPTITPAMKQTFTAGQISETTLTATSTYTASVGDRSYRWYQNSSASTDGAVLLKTTNKNNNSKDTFTIPTDLQPGVYYYYCIARNEVAGREDTLYRDSQPSNFVTVEVKPKQLDPASDITGPKDLTVTAGSIGDAKLSVSAKNTSGTVSYQWYKATSAADNSPPTNHTAVDGATSADYSIPQDIDAGTYYYRCKITQTADNLVTDSWSNIATVTVKPGALRFTKQPQGGTFTGAVPSNTQLTAAAQAAGGAMIAYQWYKTTNGTTYDESAPVGTGDTFDVLTTLQPGKHYYFVQATATFNGGAGSVTENSQIAEIAVKPTTPTLSDAEKQPTGQDPEWTLPEPSKPDTNGEYSYQWYEGTNATDHHDTDSPVDRQTGTTFTVPSGLSVGVHYFYCKITYSVDGLEADPVYSNTITVTVKPAPLTLTGPEDLELKAGEINNAQLTVSANSSEGTFTYEWYHFHLTDDSDPENYTVKPEDKNDSATAAVLPIDAEISAGTHYYRCKVTQTVNGLSTENWSRTATVTVAPGDLSFTLHPQDQVFTGTVTDGTRLTAEANADGGATITYQWYKTTGKDNLSGIGVEEVQDETDATFTVPTGLLPGKHFYFVKATAEATDGTVSHENSYVAEIAVHPTTPQLDPDDLKPEEKDDGTHVIPPLTPPDENGAYRYQWYKGTDAEDRNGTKVDNRAEFTFTVPSGLSVGVHYFYCEITYSVDGLDATPPLYSDTIQVTVYPQTPTVTITPSTLTFQVGKLPLSDEARILTANAGTPQDGCGFVYKWYLNGVEIKDATKATYTFENNLKIGLYKYVCEVFSQTLDGTLRSKGTGEGTATVVVTPTAPTVTLDSGDKSWSVADKDDAKGATYTVTATANDDPQGIESVFTYQWHETSGQSGSNAEGMNTKTLTIPATAKVGKYTYACTVTRTVTLGDKDYSVSTLSPSVTVEVRPAAPNLPTDKKDQFEPDKPGGEKYDPDKPYNPEAEPAQPRPTVSVKNPAGGTTGMSYQWYLTSESDTEMKQGTAYPNQTEKSLNPAPLKVLRPGDYWFYCMATYTENGASSSVEVGPVHVHIPGSVTDGGGNVGGDVTDPGDDKKPVSNATVFLKRGNTTIAVSATDKDGKFRFENIPYGEYNIEIHANGHIITEHLVIAKKEVESHIELPLSGKTFINAQFDVSKDSNTSTDSPITIHETVVKGLKEEVMAQFNDMNAQNLTRLELILTVKQTEKRTDSIVTSAGKDAKLDFIDVTVILKGNGTQSLTETTQPLELIIPYNFTGKKDVIVYREHDGKAAEFNLLPARPTDKFNDATFFADTKTGTIYIYAQKFSAYAIGYTADSGTSEPNPPTDNNGSSGGGGGGSSVSRYPVILRGGAHVTLSATPQSAVPGERVTVTVSADKGYSLTAFTVTAHDGKSVTVTKGDGGTYSFVQPAGGSVTVSAAADAEGAPAWDVCPKDERCPIHAFSDADPKAWYHDAVHFCIDNRIMNGTGNGRFEPNTPLSRAMMTQTLYNRAGAPAASGSVAYPDVRTQDWFFDAVSWAARSGIVKGYDTGAFGPNDPVSREQMVTILHRAAGEPNAAADLSAFPDSGRISAYARAPFAWAVQSGMIHGKDSGILDPRAGASRAEAAQMLFAFFRRT